MKKRKIQIIFILCLLGIFGFSISASAAVNGRRANIKSQGNIDADINNQKIYITSSDLRYLADEIDALEDTYKTNTVDALNSIGTYFKTDGTVVHDGGMNEVTTSEEKSALSFRNLKDAIEASQSVVSLSQTQATDKDGRLLFYKDKSSSDSKNLLNTTTANTGYPVFYQAATSENLSVGTAAWINGTLIKGKGSDNAVFYNQGVAAGEAKSKVGTATADKVLSGYTFTNSVGVGIAGTMVNKGDLNWNPTSSTTQTIQPGYYSGGTLNSSGAYNAGITFADGRINTNSASYQDGFNKGKQQSIRDLYGSAKSVKSSIQGKSINKYIWHAQYGSWASAEDSFSFDSGNISIFQAASGEKAALVSITFTVRNSNSKSSYGGESASSSSSYRLFFEDGTEIVSGETCENLTVNLLDYDLRGNNYIRLVASGNGRCSIGTANDCEAKFSASISSVDLLYKLTE